MALEAALKDLLPKNQKFIQDKYDYSIPESPGFTIIGMTPEDVVHPRTLRDFAVALKDGVDESGKFKTGIALDFTPFQWFVRDQTMARYLRLDSGDLDIDSLRVDANKLPKRKYFNSNMLASTSVSIGTTQGTGDGDESVKLGIGLHVPIIDKSDGREFANDCFAKTLFAKAQIVPGGLIPVVKNAAEVNKMTSECMELAPRWNDTIWTASLGYATTSEDGSFSDMESGAYGIWSSFAYGFDGSIRSCATTRSSSCTPNCSTSRPCRIPTTNRCSSSRTARPSARPSNSAANASTRRCRPAIHGSRTARTTAATGSEVRSGSNTSWPRICGWWRPSAVRVAGKTARTTASYGFVEVRNGHDTFRQRKEEVT